MPFNSRATPDDYSNQLVFITFYYMLYFCIITIIITIITIKDRSAIHGWEREIETLSVQSPQPLNTNKEKELIEIENREKREQTAYVIIKHWSCF